MGRKRAVSARDGMRRLRWEADMDAWWWVPIGLVAWFAVAVAVGLWLGPILRHCSEARAAHDPCTEATPAGTPHHERQAA
jgi:hypothetical protein